ncbi:PhzF family phenazine biosynthesis protein [Flavobacteriaceae bacterium XHP0103]|uniref:PhzF family phenazine biosynthesis protein n=1 Tax=Marixanthotalea marina TaxID=2844359 RepID=UPI002989BC8A|nr:PhzF family phenazine biosynthesis isomerase [Marixanthotalea marina]MBU3821320.1 PhzF family phenazine biosynthesis protein [Marixanthotalea marina]
MRLFTVDSFTSEPFKGNPAAVCVLEQPLTEAQYIGIAQEMNLPATAFVYEENDSYKLRWFTPTNEIGLCGHATLATGKILFEKLNVNKEALVFDTKGGQLTVKRKGNQIEMDFPIGNTQPEPNNDVLLERFLGEKPIAIHSDADLCLVEVESSNTVKNLEPNFALLQEHPKKRFFITAKSSDKAYDFISRVFAPDYGIDEDPVTGSAHCYLANYWSQKLSKNTLVGYQASKRGGVVECEIFGNDRVLLRGDAVIIAELLVEWDWNK